MVRKEIAVCMFLAAGLVFGSGCGQASGGRKEIEVSGTAETSVSEALGDRAGGKADAPGKEGAGQNGRESATDEGSMDGDGSGNGNGNGTGTGTGKEEASGNENTEDMPRYK